MSNQDTLTALATAFAENMKGMSLPVTFTLIDKDGKVARVVLIEECGCREREAAGVRTTS